MALKIVYIADGSQKQPCEKRLSKKELFHREAVEGLAAQYLKDEKRAKKRFAPERAEVEELERQLAALKLEFND
jgi:hypothetical protein